MGISGSSEIEMIKFKDIHPTMKKSKKRLVIDMCMPKCNHTSLIPEYDHEPCLWAQVMSFGLGTNLMYHINGKSKKNE